MAGYSAANVNRQYPPAGRIGSNPNSTYAQIQRQQLSREGEFAVKNTPFALNYLAKRIMYCSAGMTYAPDTGDATLDAAVHDYCEEQWESMGINCSMQEAYGRVGDVFLPQSGDSALQWYRDEDRLRLLEITADRIGEQYSYTLPFTLPSGESYYSGFIMRGPNVVGYKVYDRYSEATYVNPHRVDAWDMIYFRDDISGGMRGVSIFFAALEAVRKGYSILKFTMDTMQQQSKTAAIVSNNSGGPYDYSYSQQNQDNTVEYVQTYADGAIERYQVNGDNYQMMRAEHPSEAFIGGLRYLDEQSALAVRMPYAFLYSGSGTGGAPFRGDFEVAGKEITRLRNLVHRPRLRKISYVTIMDGVERGYLPPHPNITRGSWDFNSLPSADSFRDDKGDIAAIRAGLTTQDRVIRKNGEGSIEEVIRGKGKAAMLAAMEVEERNRELIANGYKPLIGINDVMTNSDNPQQSAEADAIEKGKSVVSPDGKIAAPQS